MGKLDGKVAVITSGSTGIGRGIGEAFLAEGAKVVINGRDAEKGARALKEMNAGERGHFIRGDVTVREDIDAVVDGAVEHIDADFRQATASFSRGELARDFG
jgi:3-hydroxybutyrate dehydrogenase